MFDRDADRIWRRPWQVFRPFDREHGVDGELVQSELVDLSRIVQSIEIDVQER